MILWSYLRNDTLKTAKIDCRLAFDLTGQASRLSVTIQTDIIKLKLPENNCG